ncbi:cellulase family glycosylhydrolase [Dictyobacter halimunensis]
MVLRSHIETVVTIYGDRSVAGMYPAGGAMTRNRRIFSFACVLVLAALCLGAFSLSTFSRTVKASGSLPTGLHVVSGQIQDGSGHVIVPHGVDRSGSQYQCVKSGGSTFDGPNDQTSVSIMTSWNTNIVRVPLNEDCWLGINGEPADGDSSAKYQQDIINYVNLLNQNNQIVILELHWNAPGGQQAQGQQPMPDADHAPAFWTSVANTFKNNSSVMFDLYNEPYTNSWSCWLNGSSGANSSPCNDTAFAVAGMKTLISTVRNTGSTNVILLGGLQYANDVSGWLNQVQQLPSNLQSNLVASFHIYPNNACISTSCLDSNVAPIQSKFPVIAGEIGEYDCASGFINGIMPWFDSHNIGYLGWAWNTNSCTGTPALISDFNGTPTAYGQGFKAHLATLNNGGGGGGGSTVTDPLNDYSKIFVHSSNLTFDNTNTTYFNNDSSRLTRSATSAEWAVWKQSGMTQFVADTYYWPGQTGVSDFQFYTSPDNSTYTQASAQSNNMGGNWTHIQYTLNVPAGTNYVKMVFPTNATNAWDPQIAQVTMTYTASSSTPTPTPPTPTPTSTPVSGGSCKVVYSITNQWSGGFNGDIVITNTGSTAINGRTLKWTFANDQQITNGWNGTFTQQGKAVTATNVSYNGTIAAGGNTDIGFSANVGATNNNPTSFTLNGASCS